MDEKITFYRLDKILSLNCQWNLLIGQRSNGKSYAVKEYCIKDYIENGNKFVYLRRQIRDIKENFVTSYFDDMAVKKISKGRYDGIMGYHGFIHFYTIEDDKIVRGECIGRYCALSEDYRYKSQTFEEYNNIIYEEMIPTDNTYLVDEPNRLQQFVSTVYRFRQGKVFIIGNTLSRVCPYAQEWCIDFAHQKKGTIETYNYHVDDNTVIKLAVEYCENINYKNKMFFGNSAKQITSGDWDVKNYPKLPQPFDYYENVYKVLVEYQNFKFVINLLVDSKNGGRICYIHPSTKKFNGFRILTDRFDENPFISGRLDTRRLPEKYIAECFAFNKVCYSDNLTGTDFHNVNEHFYISNMF